MYKLMKSAKTVACVILIGGLAGLPVAATAQQEAIEQYNRDRGDNQVAVVNESRALREAIDRLDSRVRHLEARGTTNRSQSIDPNVAKPGSKSLPARDF